MNNLDLKQFNTACDEMVAGKYILANIKIRALVKAINDSAKLTDLVSNSLDGFDFNFAFRESVSSNGLNLPQGDNQVIAYCFNVIYNLDNGSITFVDFLNKYFSAVRLTGGEEFKAFVNTIILPFKKAVNAEYKRVYEMTATEEYKNNLYHKLSRVAEANIKCVDDIKLKDIEKEELVLLLSGIVEACKTNNRKMVYALMVGMDYFAKANKRVRDINLQLKDCFSIN